MLLQIRPVGKRRAVVKSEYMIPEVILGACKRYRMLTEIGRVKTIEVYGIRKPELSVAIK